MKTIRFVPKATPAGGEPSTDTTTDAADTPPAASTPSDPPPEPSHFLFRKVGRKN